MPIYLYIKQHELTGLKYFGRTTKNPYKYNGSGKYWKRHVKKHGKFINTIQVWKFEDQQKCTEFALNFSKENDIVESKHWANEIIEDGLYSNGYGMLGRKQSEKQKKIAKLIFSAPRPVEWIENHKKSMIEYRSREEYKNPMLGKSHSEQSRKKISENHHDVCGKNNPMYGKKHSEETRRKISEAAKRRKST